MQKKQIRPKQMTYTKMVFSSPNSRLQSINKLTISFLECSMVPMPPPKSAPGWIQDRCFYDTSINDKSFRYSWSFASDTFWYFKISKWKRCICKINDSIHLRQNSVWDGWSLWGCSLCTVSISCFGSINNRFQTSQQKRFPKQRCYCFSVYAAAKDLFWLLKQLLSIGGSSPGPGITF